MNLTEIINKLKLDTSEDSYAVNLAAIQLESIKSELDAGNINKSEADSLIRGVQNHSMVLSLADDLEHKILIDKACSLLFAAAKSLV